MHTAILRWITGDLGAGIAATSHPLPVLPHEQDMRITEAAGGCALWPSLRGCDREGRLVRQWLSGRRRLCIIRA